MSLSVYRLVLQRQCKLWTWVRVALTEYLARHCVVPFSHKTQYGFSGQPQRSNSWSPWTLIGSVNTRRLYLTKPVMYTVSPGQDITRHFFHISADNQYYMKYSFCLPTEGCQSWVWGAGKAWLKNVTLFQCPKLSRQNCRRGKCRTRKRLGYIQLYCLIIHWNHYVCVLNNIYNGHSASITRNTNLVKQWLYLM